MLSATSFHMLSFKLCRSTGQ